MSSSLSKKASSFVVMASMSAVCAEEALKDQAGLCRLNDLVWRCRRRGGNRERAAAPPPPTPRSFPTDVARATVGGAVAGWRWPAAPCLLLLRRRGVGGDLLHVVSERDDTE
uniref:Uncharacterized protein n=1 Tax=Oryza barthii TaxID=65489 RepID=A0A0D3FGQ7_9ORYZ